MSPVNPRIQSLERLIRKYEHSILVFETINEKLRTLPPSARGHQLIELNDDILASTHRVLAATRTRLHNARLNTLGRGSASPFAMSPAETKSKPRADETSAAT